MSQGRNNYATNNASTENLKNNIVNLRRNYTYPAWFENTIQFALDGRISEVEFNNAIDNLSQRGLLKASADPIVRPPITQSFESLYPKQTQQLIKIGQDTTALGEIVTRQDATDAGFRSELEQTQAKLRNYSADKKIFTIQFHKKRIKDIRMLVLTVASVNGTTYSARWDHFKAKSVNTQLLPA
jgi:hypothetical protein